MKISGIQPTSLIDYPKHISTIIFTQGCNMNCSYCHNSSLIPFAKKGEIETDKVKKYLKDRKHLIEAVSITGGEPLLQNDIIEFIEWIKKDLKLKVKLDTNGSKPMVLMDLAKANLLDYVAMDIKMPLDRYEELGGVTKAEGFLDAYEMSINTLLKFSDNFDYEFRTTTAPFFHTKKDIESIAKVIKGADNYYIQNFKGNDHINDLSLNENRSFTEEELIELKEVAAKYVKNAEIRN
jgi:pyruvate formate lyase activating enzyme